jgi:hypothetical protein
MGKSSWAYRRKAGTSQRCKNTAALWESPPEMAHSPSCCRHVVRRVRGIRAIGRHFHSTSAGFSATSQRANRDMSSVFAAWPQDTATSQRDGGHSAGFPAGRHVSRDMVAACGAARSQPCPTAPPWHLQQIRSIRAWCGLSATSAVSLRHGRAWIPLRHSPKWKSHTTCGAVGRGGYPSSDSSTKMECVPIRANHG